MRLVPCGAMAVVAAVVAAPAWAAHGHSGGRGSSHGSSPVSGGVHGAAPVGGGFYGRPSFYGGAYVRGPRFLAAPWYVGPSPYFYHYGGWGYGYCPWFYAYDAPGVEEGVRPQQYELGVSAGAQGQLSKAGVGLGANVGVEGERVGFLADFNALLLSTPLAMDNAKLLDLHVTYALLSDPRGRLRIEAGADSAFLSNGTNTATALGPGIGASGGVGVIGPLGLEASVRGTLWPFREVDASLGATMSFNIVGLRAGWRLTWVEDNGLVDGTDHTVLFSGPYVGASLTL